MTELLLIILALALVAACGAFVAAEFSFVTVDRSSVERDAEGGDARARGALSALHSLSTQLSAAQVGITITNLLIGFLAEPSIARLIDGPLESLGLSGGAADGVSLTVALVLATGFTMIFGELVPKNLAIAHPLRTAYAVQGFQRAFTRATALIIRFTNGTANAILRRFGIEPQEELASARSAQELSSLVGRSAEQGTLEVETATLLQRSLAFGDRRAVDVMTPRTRMRAIGVDEPVMSVLRAAKDTGLSRFPVLSPGGDEVLGIVHVKHAMPVAVERRAEVLVREVMAPPELVPSSVELDRLLEVLRGGLQMAVVVDEFGDVDGVVTMEDLVEEIFGEVRDEHDPVEERARRLGTRRWALSGLLRPDEVFELTDIALPEDEEYETLGGLIGMRLERVPSEGDVVTLQALDSERNSRAVTLTVTRMDGLRVDQVRLQHEPVPDDADEAPS